MKAHQEYSTYDIAIFNNFMALMERHIYAGGVSFILIIGLTHSLISPTQIIINSVTATIIVVTTPFFHHQYKQDSFCYSLTTWHKLIYLGACIWGAFLGLQALCFIDSDFDYRITIYFIFAASMSTAVAPALCYYFKAYQLFTLLLNICIAPLFILSQTLNMYFLVLLLWGAYSSLLYGKTLNQQLHTLTRLKTEQEIDNKNKQRIINIISHDLNQPIQALDYWLKAAKNETVSFDIAERSIANIQQIIQSILQITHYRKTDTIENISLFTDQQLASVLSSTLAKSAANKNIKLQFNTGKLNIKADYNQLLQALLNLISNAIKFTEQGHITINFKTDKNDITIDVIDTGCGISQAEKPLIFNDFYTSHSPQQEGLGLGLSIVKDICEHNHWLMSVTSELNKGSQFTLRIPQKT